MPPDMKKNKILIVDDNMNNVQVLAGILENNGFDLEFALNGPDALQWLEDEHFDLVLLDIMMPVMDGFEVCRIIRDKEKTHEIPIIFLTAKTDRESLMRGFKCGGNDYLSKPYDQGELLARVNTHLELKQSRDQLKP
jgi:PleD family two-component response regulator